jgi:hypothetical protein
MPYFKVVMPLMVLAMFGAVACVAPEFGSSVLRPIESFATRLAEKRFLSICLLAAATIVIRVSLLWLLPVPVPEIQDEFSYLLAGDTFAHGRLANPPQPMSVYFDTIHVNQYPTYASIYPPAQGAILALGQLLGHPWIGVLLSVSAMCAAALWMLYGWLPPRWALLGGVLVLLRLGISSYWVNSYWGGAAAAIGGALAVGALPRILHFCRTRDAALLGIGTAILANSRPFEGLIFSLPIFVVLAAWLLSSRSGSLRVKLRRIVAPLCIVLFLCGTFILYYNEKTSGSPFEFPHTLYVQSHFSVPLFVWQSARQPLHFSNPQFEAFYNVWWPSAAWRDGRPDSPTHFAIALIRNAASFTWFYLWPELCLPLIVLLWFLRDRRIRFLILQWATCFIGFLSVVAFLSHYAAPLTATTFALVVQGLRHVRRCRFHERPLGIGISRVVVLCAALSAASHAYFTHLQPLSPLNNRAKIANQLSARPGNQLVIVRYSVQHDPHQEWVYNRADIDHAKIVWAREIPGVPLQPLLNYFRGREVWLVEPDRSTPQLWPYDSRANR